MTNDLFPSDDYVPELSLERAADSGISWVDKPNVLNPDHRKRIRGLSWLAWIVVIGLTLFMMLNAFLIQTSQKDVEMSKGELLQPVYMGKLAVGLREFSQNQGGANFAKQSEEFLESIDVGPIEQRFCHAILVNEFFGAERALHELEQLRKKTSVVKVEYNEKQIRAEDLLKSIFGDLQANQLPDLATADQEFLLEEYPWYGQLVLNPKQSASEQREELLDRAQLSVILMTSVIAVLLLLFVIGIVVGFIFTVKILGGSLRHRVVDDSRYGPVYIETFALWFLLFTGISFAVVATGMESMGVGVAALMMLLPLSALIWPVLRGVPANDMLEDVGLQLKNPFVEVLAGFAAYLALMPALLGGIICSMILIAIMSIMQSSGGVTNEFAPKGVPHPIANEAFGGDALQVIFTIFFIASVLAPLTEEIMFRGVLYRTLRDGSRRSSRVVSILFAALFSSLIFAAIHPQGIVGIPVLTILAFGFCLVRQWRGSLIACITMHAIHNGLTMSLLIPLII